VSPSATGSSDFQALLAQQRGETVSKAAETASKAATQELAPVASPPAVAEPAAAVSEAVSSATSALADSLASATDSLASATSAATDSVTVASGGALASVPQEYLLLGGAAVVAVGLLGALASGGSGSGSPSPGAAAKAAPPAKVFAPSDAVMVVGASGRVGREVVKALLASGRDVVACALDEDKVTAALGEVGARAGFAALGEGSGGLAVRSFDVSSSVPASAFEGVAQVVVTTGSKYGKLEDGSMGYIQDMTSEKVDARGNALLAAAIAANVPRGVPAQTVVADSKSKWSRLDDVIMGGSSESTASATETTITWEGTLVKEGGGFCGAKADLGQVDLSGYDGLVLKVRSNGQRYKLSVKTGAAGNEQAYQAVIDTTAGEWAEVHLPWSSFVAVKKSNVDPSMPPLEPSSVVSLSLVYSRFDFNKLPNPFHQEGPFKLEVQGGIRAYSRPRPQVVMLSSAGVERNARHGDDDERRALDVPIVQLNPGGVLNHKYAGENAYRAADVDYAIVRSTGLVEDAGDAPGFLRVRISQGDVSTGGISRGALAQVLAAAASSPDAVGKTVEVSRQTGPRDLDALVGPTDVASELRRAVKDAMRTASGLPPLPAEVPVPAPLSPERVQEILGDRRVQASIRAGRGGRTTDEASGRDLTGEERVAAQKRRVAAITADEMARLSKATGGTPPAAVAPAAAAAGGAVSEYGIPMPTDRVEPILSGNTVDQNKSEAVAWINNYKARAGVTAAAAAPAAAGGAVSEYGIPMPTDRVEPILSGNTVDQNKSEAVAWIAKYKERKSGKKKGNPMEALQKMLVGAK